MEYERIHKVQMGILSPTKLRMKLIAARKKRMSKGGSSTSQTSPSKTEAMEIVNSLLDCNPDEGAKNLYGVSKTNNVVKVDSSRVDLADKDVGKFSHGNQSVPIEKIGISQQSSFKGFSTQVHSLYSTNTNTMQQVKPLGGAGKFQSSGNDGVNTTSFEFYRVDRFGQQMPFSPFAKSVPSKWNDAEKWIVNRRKMSPSISKKSLRQNRGTHQLHSTSQCIGPELITENDRLSVSEAADNIGSDVNHFAKGNVVDKFSFIPQNSNNSCVESANFSAPNGESESLGPSQQELNNQKMLGTERHDSRLTVATEQSVLMRDIGTEMTPVPSPLDSATPSRSPLSSFPSTPRGEAPAASLEDTEAGNQLQSKMKDDKEELSQKELQTRTRKEIAALGMQLGKMKIVSWASKEEAEQPCPSPKPADVGGAKIEYEARAVAWLEVENSRHLARYKHEEVKIQAWENSQKAKLEAEMKSVEAKAEEMKALALEKMAEKLAMIKQQVEEKRAVAEARMNMQAAKVAHKAEQMRRTGQLPSTNYFCCGGLF